ncbi:UDP-glucuronosyl/UDP-glucosyltransferase [Sesbania bispinosa]|nr:UDP-glucuronosyl/UDP-glucosyltransferase [Sesbania bispinosa]
MESQSHHQLNVIFVPYPTPGHMIPMVDTARLFAKHGASVTIITTQANALTFQKAIDSDFNSGYPIRTHVLQFPADQVGLPVGVESMKDATSLETMGKVEIGISILRNQIEVLFQNLQPDCLVTDMFYPWTVECAAKLGIPRLYFYSSSYFSSCARYFIKKHKPHEGLVSDTQKFSIPCLPQNIEMTALQLEEWTKTQDGVFTRYMDAIYESESRSYGTLYNSFHELESDYEQLSESTKGIKAWSVGPISAWVNKDGGEKASRGHNEDLAVGSEWLNWLNSKQDDSVLFISFGSLTRLPYSQLVEIAHGLENSGHEFMWVIREKDGDHGGGDSFLQDFEKRMKERNKGYIIWNWAPQLLILDHPAIGGIVTHCGWNSILESLCAGLPMITWPMFAEQFYNEKLLVDVLKIGVPVGSKQNKFWSSVGEDEVLKRDEIAKAVVVLMGRDEESREMRRRARKLGNAAKKTIEEGGSSYNNLMQLLDELKSLKISRALEKTN